MLPLIKLSVHLWCYMEFCGFLAQLHSSHNKQKEYNQRYLRGDAVVGIFLLKRLGSPAFV